jgi:hypothetical protein
MVVDTAGLTQILLDGMAWGAGFAIPFFIGITWAILKILSHPTVRSIARAADKLSGGRGGIWETLIKEGFGLLKGGGPPQG